MPTKGKPPKGCYWRGETLWANVQVNGVVHRFSLSTDDPVVAANRRKAEADRLIAIAKFGEVRRTWDEAVAAWGEEIEANVGPKTVQRYLVSLGQVDRYLTGLYLDEIDRAKLGEIVTERRKARKGGATIRRDLGAVSSVLNFCIAKAWPEVQTNAARATIEHLSERRDPIVMPATADIEAVIRRAPGMFATLIEAAWRTGCRQAELVGLERSRIDFKRRQATLVGKGNKLRVIDLLDAHALLSRAPAHNRKDWVFWHSEGEPYANVASRFREMVKDAQKLAQAEGRPFRPFRFHDLRHRFAVDYLKNRRGSIYDLQRHLGHTSVKTTELYLAYLTPEEARDAINSVAQKVAHLQRFEEKAS